MAAPLSAPTVFVVAPDAGLATALTRALSAQGQLADVRALPSGDHLLRDSPGVAPSVVVLRGGTPGTPLPQVLPIVRQRAELSSTFWLALGEPAEWLGAGADAVRSPQAPPEEIAAQVRNLIARSRQHQQLAERAHTLQRRSDNWEHEERVRDQLVHMLVHDLKNPIAAVMGLLQLVEDDPALSGESRDLLRLARDESQHLLHLTVNMLDVRKIQAGKMNLRRELMFSPMLEEIIELAQGDVGSSLRERRVRVLVERDLSPASADPEILRRVLANLISNATKHTLTGGQIVIQVQAQRARAEWQISVADDGEGIPAEDIENIFAAFEQSRLTLHGRFDTGMGLAFCKMAIEQHGGRIWVESVRGEGATFIFTLPYAADAEEEEDDDFAELLS